MKHSLPFIFSLAILAAAFAPAYAQQDKNALDSLNAQVLDSTKAIIDTLKVQDSIAVRKRVKKERVKRPDSLKIKIRSGLQFYLDYGKVATLISDFEQKFEIGIGYQFSNRFQPNFQYGTGSIETGAAIENGEYASEGRYWNVGLIYLFPLDNINTLFFGV